VFSAAWAAYWPPKAIAAPWSVNAAKTLCDFVFRTKLRNRAHTIFRYKNKGGVLSNGLSLGTYREKKKGQVVFRTRGKKVNLDIRDFSGQVRTTVRLGDQCSFATAELRNGKNSLVFPIVTNPNPDAPNP